jgi:membrane-bound inhibitor of C-type lysozyme
MVMAHRPDIAHPERAAEQSGADQARLEGLKDTYTAIWWYARFPNHYAGDGSPATAQLGNLVLDQRAAQLATMIRAVKADTRVLELQSHFFSESEAPIRTPQQVRPEPSGSKLACDSEAISVSVEGDVARVTAGGRTFEMEQVRAASGARYEVPGDPTTSFWSKGRNGTLVVKGRTYPECVPNPK